MRIDYVVVLLPVPDAHDRWVLEASVDRERCLLTLGNLDCEESPPTLEVHTACSEDFKLVIEAFAPRIIIGFHVWQRLFSTATDANYYPLRVADLIECQRRYQEEIDSRNSVKPSANIDANIDGHNPFGLDLGGYST